MRGRLWRPEPGPSASGLGCDNPNTNHFLLHGMACLLSEELAAKHLPHRTHLCLIPQGKWVIMMRSGGKTRRLSHRLPSILSQKHAADLFAMLCTSVKNDQRPLFAYNKSFPCRSACTWLIPT